MIASTDTSLSAVQDRSGVAWPAIFAGAAAAAALSLILIVLGFGLGFSAVSPWPGDGGSFKQMSISTFIWLAITQILASGAGGYLAGRLRVKWASLHGDEVYFRDTAHGFLAWAIATLVTATLVIGSVSSLVGGGLQAGATVAAGAAASTTSASSSTDDHDAAYFIDTLFRDNRPVAVSDDAAHAVASRIFLRGLADGKLNADDRTYLARVIAQRTEISQAEAEQRIDAVFAQAQQTKQKALQAADTARKVTAGSALWMFAALLCGAFFASFMAIHGGRRRDSELLVAQHVPPTTQAHSIR